MRLSTQRGFTIVEIVTIVGILGILVGIGIIGLGSWQRQQAANSVVSDIHQATSGLSNYRNFKGSFPPNLAGTNFAASSRVALKLSTNAPSIGVYSGLTVDQNAQLFLNSCNANLFLTPNNTVCSFEGTKTAAKIHTKGTDGSNKIWNSPVAASDISLNCGTDQAACDAAISSMTSQFTAQGGTFPITVPDRNVPLPEPTQSPNGPADRYCIEGRANVYPDIVYHSVSNENDILEGECPSDPSLHYFQ